MGLNVDLGVLQRGVVALERIANSLEAIVYFAEKKLDGEK